MTPEERDVLLPLLEKICQTRLPDKDAEADQYIHQLVQAQPDAPYILAQTVLMQDYALHQAQARIQALEAQGRQTQQSSGGGSFLGGLFGGGNRAAAAPPSGPWGSPPQQSPYAQPINAAMAGGQPSFLRNAAQTAMGIAGGALLFQGVESLFGGHGGFGGGMMGGGFGGGPGMVDSGNTEVVNNYYDTPAPDQSAGVDNSDYSNADFDTSGSDFGGDDDSFGI